MGDQIAAVVYGFGTVGRRLSAELLDSAQFELAGVVDIDPDLLGTDVGTALERESIGLPITTHEEVQRAADIDISFVLTSSFLDDIYPVVEQCLEAETNVVATTEELFYPIPGTETTFEQIDQTARKNGVSVLCQGMNPGFIMDIFPATVSGVCIDIDKLTATRTANLSPYDTAKSRFGAGLPVEEYESRLSNDSIQTHVGLPQSLYFLGDAFEIEFEEYTESYTPIVTDEPRSTPYVDIPAGTVAGVRQQAFGIQNGEVLIELDLRVEALRDDQQKESDGVSIIGTPSMDVTIDPPIASLEGTVGHTINAAYATIAADPGYNTLLDIPPISYQK